MKLSHTILAASLFIFSSLGSAAKIHPLPQPMQHVQANTTFSHWVPMSGPQDSYGYDVVQAYNNPSTLFAFSRYSDILYRTEDQGQTWKKLTLPNRSGIYYLITQAPNKVLFITSNAIFSSDDLGDSWNKINHDIDGNGVLVALNPSQLLWVKQRNRHVTYFLSNDAAKTWIQIDPKVTDFPYAMARDNVMAFASDVLSVSTDSGQTFKTIKSKSFYVGLVINNKHEIFVADENTIYKVDPELTHMQQIWTTAGIADLQIDVNDNMYCSTDDGVLYKSSDSGKTWEKVYQAPKLINKFTPLDDGKVIVSTQPGLLISDKTQQNFTAMNTTFKGLSTQKILAADENHVFEILNGYDDKPAVLYRSEDKGITWTASFSDAADSVKDVVLFKNQLVITTGKAIYRSADLGKNWELVSTLSNEISVLGTYAENVIGGDEYDYNKYVTNDLVNWKLFYHLQNNVPTSTYIINKTLFVTHIQDVLASNDNGATWQTVYTNVDDRDFGFLSGYQDKVLLVYYHNSGDLFKSTDAGKTWVKISNNLPSRTDKRAIDVVCLDENTYVYLSINQIFMTYDGGQNWQTLNKGLKSKYLNNLFNSAGYLFVRTDVDGFYQAV